MGGASGPTSNSPIPGQFGRLPADLVAVVALVIFTDLVVLAPLPSQSPLRIALGLAFVLVLPGYAVVAALFPERGEPPEPESDDQPRPEDDDTRGIDGIERAALSVALSIPLVGLAGLALSLTSLGVTLVPILLTLNAVTLGATTVAVWRRRQLPPADRFRVPYRAWFATGREAFREPDTRADLLLNAVLVASVVLAMGSVTYAVAAPGQGESYTEFYLLTENETGALVAEDYPTEFTVGESRPVVVGVENHEHESVGYTVVAQLQQVQIEGNTTTVTETARLDRVSVTLENNETWQQERAITPTMAGQRLRVAFLLYRGSPPDRPSVENAYREVHLWVTVEPENER